MFFKCFFLLVLLHLVLKPCGHGPQGRTLQATGLGAGLVPVQNRAWSQPAVLGARLVPVQNSAWSQPAVLGDIPAQNLLDGATSPCTVPWVSEPVSQEL